MNRPGAILFPMLAGFVVTVAVVSWRTGSWPWRGAPDPAAVVPTSVQVRRSNLRIIPVHLTAASPVTGAAAPLVTATPTAAPAAQPEPAAESYEPPPVPRVDPGNSPERLEAPARKFARGSRADED